MSYQFGVGVISISATSLHPIGKLQNVSFNVTYDSAQLRGGTDVFAIDTQFHDGAVEGSFEYGDLEMSAIGNLIADMTGAAGSGTTTVTAISRPLAFTLIFSSVTNGITATITLPRVFIPSLTLDFSRTDYMIPSANFIAQATGGTILSIVQ